MDFSISMCSYQDSLTGEVMDLGFGSPTFCWVRPGKVTDMARKGLTVTSELSYSNLKLMNDIYVITLDTMISLCHYLTLSDKVILTLSCHFRSQEFTCFISG